MPDTWKGEFLCSPLLRFDMARQVFVCASLGGSNSARNWAGKISDLRAELHDLSSYRKGTTKAQNR